MRESFFDVLNEEGLNRLTIHYSWKNDKFSLYAAKEWDDDVDFSGYNTLFSMLTLRPSSGRYLNDEETVALFEKHGYTRYLGNVKELVRKGRHILMDFYYHRRKDIRCVANIHCDRPGINNLHSSLFIGGIRRHEPDEAEFDVLFDGLNLGRGMAFKNIAADIPLGGCKVTVQMNPIDLDDLDSIGFLAYANDRARNTTGPDMGFPPELSDVWKRNFSPHITGVTNGVIGPTGIPAAWGVYSAVKEAAKFVFGSDSLEGRTIAVQGLGTTGSRIARYYAREGAKVYVSDIDIHKVKELAEEFPELLIPVHPEKILGLPVDILSPAAMGAIFHEKSIPELKAKVIIGPANNTLKASGQEEEYILAKKLADKGILYQVDWYHNVGGVMGAYEEYVRQEKADSTALMDRVWRLIGGNTRENLLEAAKLGITPTENAYRIVESKIYS